MTGTIQFVAAGVPKGQPRPRAFAFHGKARLYDPGTAEHWKGQIAAAAKPHIPREPLSGPLALRLDFKFPRPKFHSTKKGLKPDAPVWHVGKPDCDNCAKAVMDAMTVLRFWNDDSQVASLSVFKDYSNSFVGCQIQLRPL